MWEKLLALFTSSSKAVEVTGQVLTSLIEGLTSWVPNRRSEEETKQKVEEVKLAMAQDRSEVDKLKITADQIVQQAQIEVDKLTLKLREVVATTKAGQFVIYGFGSVTIIQLAFNGLVAPFTKLTVLPIANEQWYLLFGIMGLEKLIDLITRNATIKKETV